MSELRTVPDPSYVPTVSRTLLLLSAALSGGCSLVLDFSDEAVPKDASIDAVFNQAECDFGEPNDTGVAASALDLTSVGPAAICNPAFDDHDFYRVTVPANSSVSVKVTFISTPTGDLDLRLYDGTGVTVIGRSNGFGNVEEVVCPGQSPACLPLAPGDYVFEVFPAVAGASNRYDIAVTVTP
jgi:hypothetical protein